MRHRGNVHMIVRTEHGPSLLCFTPALAAIVGRELGLRSIAPVGERLNHTQGAHLGKPLEKPSGGVL